MERLTAVFTLDEVKFKPQSVKGNRALAVAYIDSRTIQERLDDVLGPEGWEDAYEVCEGGSVKCRLRLKLNGQWVSKEDVGSPSEQSDAGDRLKAAFSDALKRAAVKFGIGRYLYRLPLVWCDYDIARKQFTNRPQLPDWAKPKPGTTVVQNAGKTRTDAPSGGQKPKNDKPKNGTELLVRLQKYEDELIKSGVCKIDELVNYIAEQCKAAKLPHQIAELNSAGIDFAIGKAKEFVEQRAAKKADPPALHNGQPNGTSVTIRAGLLNSLREWGEMWSNLFNEPLDAVIRRQCRGATFADLEARPDRYPDSQIADLTKFLEECIGQGVPD